MGGLPAAPGHRNYRLFQPGNQKLQLSDTCNKGQVCLLGAICLSSGQSRFVCAFLRIICKIGITLLFSLDYLTQKDRQRLTGTPFAFRSGLDGKFSSEVSGMPIYEYECIDCSNRFEVLQGVNEKPDLRCEDCKSGNIRRILSPGAFVFKGNGFYATDYKAKGRKADKAEVPACDTCPGAGGCPAAKKAD
jgi:putative FmdB family regulatory protein